MVLIWNGKKCETKRFLDIQNGYRRSFKKKTFTKKVARVIWTMFEPTAGRLQLDINSLLVNIYTYRQLCWERGNIHCVRPLGRMHTILVFFVNNKTCSKQTAGHRILNVWYGEGIPQTSMGICACWTWFVFRDLLQTTLHFGEQKSQN